MFRYINNQNIILIVIVMEQKYKSFNLYEGKSELDCALQYVTIFNDIIKYDIIEMLAIT